VNDQFFGFAKIGGLIYEGDEIDSDVTWALGAGIQYNFKYGFGIRAEYEWFSDIDSVGDTSLISAGLVFNFD
jgi:opacity protein-like surface antigen